MKQNMILNTCDRCGYSFQEPEVTVSAYSIMTDEEKAKFHNREMLHNVGETELCTKCYDEYKQIFKEFMDRGKEE